MVRKWIWLFGLVFILAAATTACRGPGEAAPQGINEGNNARKFTLESIEGTKVSLGDYEGDVVLINFWATWCAPCRAEIPDLEKVYNERKNQGFVVLGVNVEETAGTVQPFVDEFGMTYPVLLDSDGELTKTYRAMGLPMSVLVDQNGVIRERHVGFLSDKQLGQYLSVLMP